MPGKLSVRRAPNTRAQRFRLKNITITVGPEYRYAGQLSKNLGCWYPYCSLRFGYLTRANSHLETEVGCLGG
jgi:hypothetical protein